MLNNNTLSLRCGAAFSAFALAIFHLPAMAADTAPNTAETAASAEEPDEDADYIVVTGYRSSNAAAVNAKRSAIGISDSVAQDQAGLLPDLTIAQVAQRIAGVALVPDFATADDRSPDLAESVMIRGMGSSFNTVTIDGIPLASTAASTRGARIELLPPSFVSRIDAVKTITANLDPHALSGQLDLITSSAFNTRKTTLVARFSVGDNSTAGALAKDQGQNVRTDATFSTLFGANRDLGFVLSGSFARYFSSNYDQKPGAVDNSYVLFDKTTGKPIADYNDLSNTNAYPTAARNQIFVYDDKVTRASTVAKLEYNPSDATYAALYSGYFYQKEDEVRNEYLASANTNSVPLNQTATSGTWAQGKTALGYSHQPQKRETFVASALLDQDLSDQWAFHVRASHSIARLNTVRDRSKFEFASNSADGGFSYDLSKGYPILDFGNPAFNNDPANYRETYIQSIYQRAAQDLTFIGINVDHNFDVDDRGFGFNAGFSYQSTDQSYDVNQKSGRLDTVSSHANRTNMVNFTQKRTVHTTDPDIKFLFIDDAAYRAAWAAAGYSSSDDDSRTNLQSDYQLNEKVLAAFAEVNYRTDALNVRAGLRYDDTKNVIDLYARDLNITAPKGNAGAQMVEVQRNANYRYWLPSLVASYDMGGGFIARAGYSKTIGRPNFNYYAVSESISIPEDGDENVISITRGNEDLKPRTSHNYDLSLELYTGRGSMVSLAFFYKDMKNLIFTQRITDPNFELDGVTYLARITTPMNSQSASLKGVELSVRQDLGEMTSGFLKGFVISGNATYIKGKQTVVLGNESLRAVDGLEGQPEFLANSSISYETSAFGASLAYGYVADYLKSISANSPVFDIHSKARGEFSAQARLKLVDNVTMILEGQNLTKTNIEYFRKMPSGELLAERAQKGRTLWLGVNARF